MDPVLLSIQEYIKSGEYFIDARKWYNLKYLYPVTQRTILFIFCCILLIPLFTTALNINSLLPLVKQIRYSISSNNSGFVGGANVIHANQIKNDPLASIATLMITDYITKREEYDYNKLKQQFSFVQNNSTRVVFRKFYNFMNIDNQLSPIMLYQKTFKRFINILSTTYNKDEEVVVKFESLAKNINEEIIENMVWQATIGFDIDQINLNLAINSKFNFVVTSYKLKLLENKLENKNNK